MRLGRAVEMKKEKGEEFTAEVAEGRGGNGEFRSLGV
jgi:hypothetical protein